MNSNIKRIINKFDQEYSLFCKKDQSSAIYKHFKSHKINEPKESQSDAQLIVICAKPLNYISGQTIIKYHDGSIYIGNVIKNQRHGFGIRSFSKLRNCIYVGDFQYDVKQGKGEIMDINTGFVIYKGEYSDNVKHGKGTFKQKTHKGKVNVYKGEFSNNMIHGKGKMMWENGDTYEGEFKNGKRDGKGTFSFANGDKLIGKFMKNDVIGEGTYTWSSGKTFKGKFDDKQLKLIKNGSDSNIVYDSSVDAIRGLRKGVRSF